MDKEEMQEEIQQGYVPRPACQVWAARIGVVLMLAFVAYQLLTIAGAGR